MAGRSIPVYSRTGASVVANGRNAPGLPAAADERGGLFDEFRGSGDAVLLWCGIPVVGWDSQATPAVRCCPD